MKPEAKKTALFLVLNTAILLFLYYWIPERFHFAYLPPIYLLAGAVLALYYVIYNRGFTGRNITPEMLPPSMSPVEKQRFIDESRERLQKSKWVLTVLVPLVLVFFVDMIVIFVVPLITGWLA